MANGPSPKDEKYDRLRQEAADVTEESVGILREVARRLEKISDDLRKEGAFPIASLIDAERVDIQGKANGLYKK